MKIRWISICTAVIAAVMLTAACGGAEDKTAGEIASTAGAPAFSQLPAAQPGQEGQEAQEAPQTQTGVNSGNLLPSATAATGAQDAEAGDLPGIPVDAERAEAVSVYYGSICYSLYSEERNMIDQAARLFTGFSLEEAPDGQLDPDTTYQVYFSTAEEQIAAVNVDGNGMFYLPDEKKFYRVAAGTFHYEILEKIYRDSMNEDEFDPDQCYIR